MSDVTENSRAPARLTEDHKEALKATDVFFGGFCGVSLLLAIETTIEGSSTWRAPAGILLFLLANVAISQVSLRVKNAYGVEVLRAAVGAVIVPMAYVMVDGPMAPWWPGAIINSLGGAIVLGLLTQRPFWGRVLAVYYVVILALTVLVAEPDPDWHQFMVHAGVLAMVGLLFAGVMSLLGQSLAKERERRVELAKARDALFAEMEVAQEIQTVLLPEQPVIPDHEVFGRMVPADEVGGDYYDVLSVDTPHGKRTFAAIGDVSGHGVTSGLTMMMARASLMGAVEAEPCTSLPDLYATLNRCVWKNMKRMDLDGYMTFMLLEYLGEGRYAAVGRHLPVLIHRAQTNTVEELDHMGAWLGVLDDLEREQIPVLEFQLGPGDAMMLYTDGILEHGGEVGEMFGLEGISAELVDSGDQTPDAVTERLLSKLRAHCADQEDDVTMLFIRRTEPSLTEVPLTSNDIEGVEPDRSVRGVA